MSKRKSHGIPLKWPQAGVPAERLSEPERNAVALHPMITGVGNHPRVCSDADWIAVCVGYIHRYGRRLFAEALLRLLKMTDQYPWAQPVYGPKPSIPGPIGPQFARAQDLSLPMPSVRNPTGEIPAGGWTSEYVGAIALNPIYTGLGSFAQQIQDRTWVVVLDKLLETRGIEQTLVDFLYVLKHTFGAYGVHPGVLGEWDPPT